MNHEFDPASNLQRYFDIQSYLTQITEQLSTTNNNNRPIN